MKIGRLLGLFFLFTILISVISAPVFAATPVKNCFKILWFTICIPVPPKPTLPNPFPFPTKKPTPSPTIKPTSTPTVTPTPTATPTLIPIAECSASTTCGNACSYGAVTYNTVLIGTQCWLKKNLNVGIIVLNTDTPDSTAPTLNDPSTVQKWCYDDSAAYCDTEGGLYTWAEANGLPNSCNSTSCSISTPNQGICPAGWHIPADSEQYTLENYLTTSGQSCDAARSSDNNAWGCSDAGDKLRLGGSSGFDALGAGYHGTLGVDSNFDKREPSAHFWSSSEQLLPQAVPSYAWNRVMHILGSGSEVYRSNYLKAFGMSVRCVANTTNL